MFKQILAYFDNQHWKYHLPETDKTLAVFGLNTTNGKFHCIVDVDEVNHNLIFFSVFPVNVPENLRREMAELIIRVNYMLFWGSFEMDFDDGEVRLKTSIIYEDIMLTDKVLEHIIKGNIAIMDKRFELLNEFITQKIDKAIAIKKIKEL